ncbi:MAG TPA: response regulator transcription factor [Pirellulaceae bacterium]|nr:response regulator transcription factor [Planctomycetales bacterium]HRX77490.1 response regulator transcription factor [Pirellulaceae bacterium]
MIHAPQLRQFRPPMTQARQVLTIEDDAAIRRGIVDALEFAGYHVIEAADGESGLDHAVRSSYDLLLLDLVLPHRGGLEILRELRVVRPTVPVIILSARGEEQDRVRGLQMGADDYVVKPFSVKELLARVEAVLRRSPERPSDLQQTMFPGGHADFARREVRYDDGGRSELSEREVELLRYLVINAGRAIDRDELLSNVWRISPRGAATRTIDMHIARLREKLRDDSSQPQIVLTVRGKGYMFANSAGDAS